MIFINLILIYLIISIFNKMKNIDTDLYSRQIKTYGIETMSKLQNLRILIVGMRGLGTEVSKNVILSGVKEVKILGEGICQINELFSI